VRLASATCVRPALAEFVPVTAWLTRHARERCQQRAVSAEVLEWLLDHGVRRPAGAGNELLMLDEPTRRMLGREIGRLAYARHERKLSTAYALVGADGQVITVGHRTRPIRRH
jgi:hypothetical protein